MSTHSSDTPATPCPACGAPVTDGRAGCQALWDAHAARAYSIASPAAAHPAVSGVSGTPLYGARYDLAFDTYCMQHPDDYCVSAKSYAAHLTRLCCGLEYARDPAVYAAIQKWLSTNPALTKPVLIRHAGTRTIADLHAAAPHDHIQCVEAWAADVWAAYTNQHPLARAWIATACAAHPQSASRKRSP